MSGNEAGSKSNDDVTDAKDSAEPPVLDLSDLPTVKGGRDDAERHDELLNQLRENGEMRESDD